MFGFDAYTISLATTIGISVAFALSLNLITGFCGQISLGHAAFYGIGAYCAALLTKGGFPFLPALLAGGVLAALVGTVMLHQSHRLIGEEVEADRGQALAMVVGDEPFACLSHLDRDVARESEALGEEDLGVPHGA